jgi:signal transduction histidine kinase/DNA-binding response OmpR family regulator
MLFVALAFALMVVSSYFFVARIERRHLANDARSALSYAQANIEADLNQAGLLASGISYTIRGMVLSGATLSDIQKHFQEMDDFAYSLDMVGFDGFFGHFEIYGGADVNAKGRYLPEGVRAEDRPWYAAAEEANGKPAITEPYFSLNSNNLVLTYARRVYDDDGKPLCIIGMNITFDGIARHIHNISELARTEGTYGVLHDKHSMIIVHPNKNLVGKNMGDMDSSISGLEKSLTRYGRVDEHEALNLEGEKVIVFFTRMDNGWQLGVLTLKGLYYKNMRVMAMFLAALGAFFAALLCYILMGITRAKRRADEFTRIVFDAMPLACDLWDGKRNNVMCNEEAVRLHGARSKQDYLDKFFDFSPEYQPCGKRSRDLCREVIDKAFTEGYARAEWMHKTWDGRPLPSEVTMVRITYKGDLAVLAYKRDLREEKATLDRIREADERAHSMFDAAPLGITMWDINGNLIDCNMEAARAAGVSSKQEYIDKFQQLAPECQSDGRKSLAVLTEAHIKTFKEGYCRLDWEHGTVNGEIVPFDITCVRLRYKDGYVAVSYARDLRELHAAMDKTREADERIQAIFNATPLAITMWNPANGTLLDCNMEAVRVVGMADKKTYIERFAEMSPEYQPSGQKTSEMVAEIFDKTMKGGVCRYKWEQMDVSGEFIPFQVTTVRLKQTGGYIVISYAQDMRETNAAIAKMRETDEFTQVMFKAMPFACQMWNKELQCVMCNDEAMRVYRAADRRRFLENFFDYSPERQPCGTPSIVKGQGYLRKGFEDGYFRFEWIHKRGDGEEFPCEITMIRALFNGEPALLTYTRDLSEEMAMTKEKHRAEVAEESNKAKSRFLAAMSHEIRTPMNVILGITEIQLQDEYLPPHLREAFLQIYNSSNLLLGIINDILDLSKIEAGKMEFTPAWYKLASLINDTVHLNMMRNSKPIEFELEVDEAAPANLFGDELRIKQILNNLLSNAFKFTGKGTIKLSVSVEDNGVTDERGERGVTLVFTVSDTGQGMTAEQLGALFSEYTRFNLHANRAIEGTGLGMNITRDLVNMMGGVINVDSAFGEGTKANVRLPQRCRGTERIGSELAESMRRFRVQAASGLNRSNPITREYMPYGRVLIVDDVESNLYVAKGLMAPYGLVVDTVSSGSAAVEKIKSGEVYDVIFMDHMMPGMDGIEAVKIIRGFGYAGPIVALTANAVVGQAEMFLSNGFNDFISKPVDIRQLNATLNKLIRDKQSPEIIENARVEWEKIAKSNARYSPTAAPPELLAIFARDANRVMPAIEAVSKNGGDATPEEMHQFTVGIHAMKSALANIGETRLSQMAFTLERAGKSSDKNTIAMQSPSFIKALREIVAKAEADSKTKILADKDEDPKLLREQLAIINKACCEYDERTVDEALDRLKDMAWTAETQEALDKISLLLLHSEFEEAADVAEKLYR